MTEPASVNAAPVENGVATSPEEQPGTKVFAGNLAYTTTDESLKTFFSPVADDIVSAQVIFRGSRSAGYGFVAFKTAEAAEKAVELLNKKELDGRTLIVEVAKPNQEKREREKTPRRVPQKRVSKKAKAPAANGDAATTEATTENKESGAAASDADKPRKKRNTRKTKKPRTAAKEGEAPAAATNGDKAVVAPASDAKPKKARAPRPREPRERKPARPVGETPAGEPSKTTLFVANLGFSVDDNALTTLFTDAGVNVVSARVVLRRWGGRRSKGYGFVDVGSEDEQKKALELLQGKELGGREIAVKIAVNAQEREDEAAESGAVPSLITA